MTSSTQAQEAPWRAGYVALVGRPNVGKSTLLNQMVGEWLAAVSPKPQTTRLAVRGIVNGPSYQIVVCDTPGLADPRTALDKTLLRAATRTASLADVIVAMVRPWQQHVEDESQVVRSLPGQSPVVVAINKIDLVPKPTLLPLIAHYASLPRVQEVVPISATRRDGVDELISVIVKYLPLSGPLYPPDQLSDQPQRLFVAEILRECIMYLYRQEIPYATAVEIEEFSPRSERLTYVKATVWVERESQRAILVGKDGTALKKLGTKARARMEQFLGTKVYLDLWVKVRPKWRESPQDLARLGFENP